MEHLVKLVEHLAWPVLIAVFGYVYREQLREIAWAIVTRVKDPHTEIAFGSVHLKPSVIEQKAASPTPVGEQLVAKVKSDKVFRVKLHDWMKNKGLEMSTTTFLYGSDYQSLREAAAQDLLQPTDSETN